MKKRAAALMAAGPRQTFTSQALSDQNPMDWVAELHQQAAGSPGTRQPASPGL
ncbi:MAG: hypothetical protein ACYCW6_13645 [Candidatus Xenobia bacterium]